MKIAVLVPSRGRPERALAMWRSAMETATSEDVEVRIIVDPDDPALADYVALRRPGYANVKLPIRILPERLGYTGSLNLLARERWDDADVLGAFGDDVLFRTPGWDALIAETLSTPGIAYGDDLIHGRNHPSAVFMSSVIAKALGWLALPATSHQWADDGWKRLGQETGCLRFVPEVTVEHMHPAVDKAPWDDTYASVFEDERAKRDYEGFTGWVENGGLAADAEKVRAVVGVTA